MEGVFSNPIFFIVEMVRILSIGERIFRQIVSGTSSTEKGLHLKLLTKTVYEATINDIFKGLFSHDMETATNLDEDFHSTQFINQ